MYASGAVPTDPTTTSITTTTATATATAAAAAATPMTIHPTRRYFGFSWSDDGVNWPDTQGELFSVLPPHAKPGSVWTDLVRTPTSLIEEADGTFTFFYAARDTRGFEPPYVNCSVPPKPLPHMMLDGMVGGPPPPPPGWTDGCFWGIGKMTVRLNFPQ